MRTATAPPRVDADGFASVFNAHHRQALRLAYLLTADAQQAEDVVSEVFAKVWQKWRRGEVRDVGPYVRRAVVNQANSRLRRRYLERAHHSTVSGDGRGGRAAEDLAADRDEVWNALLRLADGQRQAVVLRYYEDLSEAETAAILGVTVGTVKSQVSRGLARLEQLLATAAGGR